jgi:hypothetical protein
MTTMLLNTAKVLAGSLLLVLTVAALYVVPFFIAALLKG